MATSSPKRKKTLIYILAGLFVLLVIAAAIKARQKPKGESVTVEKVQPRTIRETVSASGKIFPETEVKISSDVSGEIVELYVKEGDSVTVGQVLAKIKPDEYQSAVEQGQASLSTARAQREISESSVKTSTAQLEQAKADVSRASAQLNAARNTHKRNEQLYKDGVISTAEFETSLSNLRAAESAMVAAESALKTADNNLASARENVRVSVYGISSASARLKELSTSLQKTVITAPVSGIVSALNVEKGERVVGTLQMAGTEMMRIANLSSMEVQVDVSENDILKVSVNDDADIEVDAYLGRKFKGKVTEIANSASNLSSASLNTDQVTNFVVKIRVDPVSYSDLVKKGMEYPFRPGMSAAVDIYTHTADSTLSVPIIAVTAKEEKETNKAAAKEVSNQEKKKDEDLIKEIVFVVVGDTVAVREVKTGIQDNDHIQILKGLEAGETVVTGPYSAIARKLKSGSRISVENKDDEKGGNAKKGGISVEVD
ncbi:MAG: efflux RND transporter periplasmic adaptor subunit [Lewinellaceae bacterium]|nr:efflux RND transporter periplasmic adaptor subunit [Saprospiraceae bacterium]MCB0544866.1 efflux RND transporter periplasmic adaptor subunit [Saprospiraceae bacterium]MCB9307029.1 efflux RND transporter periplasmic adaptor subunit [Lewinellaceae bacterium]MCB9355900.1 efflux RND transporter periplasmic adaptor subunit [Lewinellaceae bacterium]